MRVVVTRPAGPRAVLTVGTTVVPCAIGRHGARIAKREGDGATPIGVFALRWLLYRADRMARPRTVLAARAVRRHDGWCDDPQSRRYNHPVFLPFAASHERLWRDDGRYDLVIGLGHNDRPVRPGHGSAIFLHVASPGLAPTAGCVALRGGDLRRLLARLADGAALAVCTPGVPGATLRRAPGAGRRSPCRPAPRSRRRRSPPRSRGSCPWTAP